MNTKSNTLWTREFTGISAAAVLSAIGGEAMNLPISLLVFDETKSAFLSSLVLVCGILPDILIPVLIAPLIDKGGKKKWIVGLDILLVLIYLGMAVWTLDHGFQYWLYLGFVLMVGTISVFYRLAYSAWYPSLIPEGLEQKGYAVSSTIYPLVTISVSPAVTFIYEKVSMSQIFFLVAGITCVSVVIESCIREKVIVSRKKYTLRAYFNDMRDGFAYLKNEKGIRNIYTYMSITSGTSDGMTVLTQAFYQTQPYLTVTMLGFLKSAEMIGRGVSGIFQYRTEIPVKKRYAFTKMVYIVYSIMDLLLLFLPYPVMLLNRFVCGALGTSSATIRETAVQSYLPENMRARINAFFNMVFAIGSVTFQLLAGIMGQVMSYRLAIVLLSVLTLVCVGIFIVLPAKENRPVYEAVRGSVPSET